MHLHEIARLMHLHLVRYTRCRDYEQTMKRKPSTEATAAWIRLMRLQTLVLDALEQDLKKAGFPPLAWYDALLELSRAPSGEIGPVELDKQMLARASQD